MWLFTRYGFFSIACAKQDEASSVADPDQMMVRARQRRHLENLKERFPELSTREIKEGIGTDYAYRLLVPKSVCATIAANLVQEQTWSNFKDEAARFLGHDCADYEDALHRVWRVMWELQNNEPAP